MLVVFNDIKADRKTNEKLNPIVTEWLFKRKIFNISLVFILQSYFKVPKSTRLNATHYSIMKIPNKKELQQKVSNHSSDIEFKDFVKLYKDYTKEPFSFLVSDTILSSDDPLSFRKNLI